MTPHSSRAMRSSSMRGSQRSDRCRAPSGIGPRALRSASIGHRGAHDPRAGARHDRRARMR
jgi:hypothetical protein